MLKVRKYLVISDILYTFAVLKDKKAILIKKGEIGMKYEDYPIINDYFEYDEKNYDCSLAIKRDIKMILQEAETSHKDSFDKLYNRDSLKPNKVRIFLDEKDNPVFGMVIYLIEYKDGSCKRESCGGYYPFWEKLLLPHPYQESVCW